MKNLARWLKATADETRLRILYLLSAHGELCVCDLHEALDITQSRASRHLRTLLEVGLVEDRRVGLWTHYWIPDLPPERVEMLGQLLNTLSQHGEAGQLDRALDAWLDRKKTKEACT